MPTKTQLEDRVEALENEVRRLQRAERQATMNLPQVKALREGGLDNPEASWSPHAQQALGRALCEWDQIIKDPDAEIDRYIRSREGLGWSWSDEYQRNGQFAWCGAFAAFCWTQVKFPIRQKIFPSCYRLYEQWSNTARRIKDPSNMLPGDIVVISTVNGAKWGDHITLCHEAPNGGDSYEALEGNAKGTLGDGSTGEGVIKQTRPLSRVMFVYRVLEEDLDV